jgi:uncharacterized protein with HEPN domain
MPPRTRNILEDIRDELLFIIAATSGKDLTAYVADGQLRRSVERAFEIVGEAMRRLSDLDLDTANRLTGRSRIIAFRNVLIHGYDVIDHAVVWDIVHERVPELKSEVDALLTAEDEAAQGDQ